MSAWLADTQVSMVHNGEAGEKSEKWENQCCHLKLSKSKNGSATGSLKFNKEDEDGQPPSLET